MTSHFPVRFAEEKIVTLVISCQQVKTGWGKKSAMIYTALSL
jgi:hypothetical protein